MNALELKRNTWYEVLENTKDLKKGDIVKRGKWVRDHLPIYDDHDSVAFYKKGTKRRVWDYLRPAQVKELHPDQVRNYNGRTLQ